MPKKSNNRRRDGLGMGSRSEFGLQPPPHQANVVLRHKWRFRTDGTNAGITATFLCNLLSVGYIANTSVSGLFKAVRIRKITIWFRAPTTVAGTSTGVPSASVTWDNNATTSFFPSNEVAAEAMSNALPTRLIARPPPRSLASDWAANAAGQLFVLKAPQGSLVEMDLEHVLLDGDSGQTTATAACGVGYVYAMPLDGASDTCIPLGLVTTT